MISGRQKVYYKPVTWQFSKGDVCLIYSA